MLLSEAPLFGTNETYFYNPDSHFTSFFHFNDAMAVLGESFADGHQFLDDRAKKEFLHAELANAGVIILDIFPFALNPRHTLITYRNLSAKEYETLFLRTSDLYFKPKLTKLMGDRIPHFAFRYQRVAKRLERQVTEAVNMVIGKTSGFVGRVTIDKVCGTNMTLDREKLRTLCKTSSGVPQ